MAFVWKFKGYLFGNLYGICLAT